MPACFCSYCWYIKDLGWGNLRHMCDAAMLALVASKYEKDTAKRDQLVCWAHGQMHYALGDTGAWVPGWAGVGVHHLIYRCAGWGGG